MNDHRTLDYLRGIIAAEPDFIAPSISSVKMQVRTGASVMPKKDMLKVGYVVLVWSYHVKDPKAFDAFMGDNEEEITALLKRDPYKYDDAGTERFRLGYHGTFPVRSAGGTASNRYKTMWGGEREWVHVIEKCRLARVGKLAEKPTEQQLAEFIGRMFSFVDGEMDVEFLDPSVERK